MVGFGYAPLWLRICCSLTLHFEILFLYDWEIHVFNRVRHVLFATKIWMFSDTIFSIIWDMDTSRPRIPF